MSVGPIIPTRFPGPDGYTLAGYERTGGYQALRKALGMSPEAVHEEVKTASVLGRGSSLAPNWMHSKVDSNDPDHTEILPTILLGPSLARDRPAPHWPDEDFNPPRRGKRWHGKTKFPMILARWRSQEQISLAALQTHASLEFAPISAAGCVLGPLGPPVSFFDRIWIE